MWTRAPALGAALILSFLSAFVVATESSASPMPQPTDAPPQAEAGQAGELANTDSLGIARIARYRLEDFMVHRPTVQSPPRPEMVTLSIEKLDELAGFTPGSNWIIGHRVGLRVLSGDMIGALRVATGCVAQEWWCSMLEGYVLHILTDYEAAEKAFDAGLAAMTPADRCSWMEDVALILSGETSRAYRNADCATRMEMERRIWWLADPLYLMPVNDRRTEHLARSVAMHLHHEALEVIGEACTHHHAPEIRTGWERWAISYLMDAPAGRLGYGFVLSGPAGSAPLAVSDSDWNLYAASSLERYWPSYGPIGALDRQIALFLRGDSVAVVAGAEIAGRPLAAARLVDQGLVMVRSETDEPRIVRGERTGDRFVFRAMAPAEPHLVGIEIISADRGAARARFGHAPPTRMPGRVGLSDLLLFDWDAGVAEELDAVAPRVIGTHRIQRDRDIGVFWEIYGLEGDEVDLSLVITGQSGLLRRLIAAIGLGGRGGPTSLAWKEVFEAGGGTMIGRSLRVGVGDLPTGEYTLEVTARDARGETRTATRRIELVDG